MAAITWYATNNLVSVHQEMSETDPGTEAYASPVTGWVVSTGSTNHGEFRAQTEQAASVFVDTGPPDGSINTTNGDCLRSATTYNGDFASANWNVHFACRANTNGGAQDGRMRCRLFRSANADGSSATEITSAQQQGGLVSNLATSTTQVSTATFNPGAFTVTNEYIFIQLAWERTGAGGMTSSDVNMRIGNGSGTGTRVITSDFTPAGQTYDVAVTFTGSAAATFATSQDTQNALPLSGSAAASFETNQVRDHALPFSSSAGATFEAAFTYESSATFTGSASVSFAGDITKEGAITFSASAAFAPESQASFQAGLALTATATAGDGATATLPADLALSGAAAASLVGALSVDGALALPCTAALLGATNVAGAPVLVCSGSAAATFDGELSSPAIQVALDLGANTACTFATTQACSVGLNLSASAGLNTGVLVRQFPAIVLSSIASLTFAIDVALPTGPFNRMSVTIVPINRRFVNAS